MTSGYSDEQLLKAQSRLELAARLIGLAIEGNDSDRMHRVGEALDAADKAYEELDVSSSR